MTETVLVVDDDPEFRAYMAEALARHGYTVHTARYGRDAVILAETAFFDLIVTDVYMPEADGIDLVRELRRRQIEIPVIAVTGGHDRGTPAVIHFLRQAGVAVILEKPICPARLQRTVAEVLAGVAVTPAAATPS